MMSLGLSSSSSLFSKPFNGTTKSSNYRFRASSDVPDFLSVDWYAFNLIIKLVFS
ncbi:hypothetical protein HanPI659440_Chr13g0487881 [Helianthus annuus]|nr:hypothetical protein HanPI659440_Chr13g0487881 [Helianthus annuus]